MDIQGENAAAQQKPTVFFFCWSLVGLVETGWLNVFTLFVMGGIYFDFLTPHHKF